ncbi:MAG: hypothetical protein MUO26_14575 [Methanotrichaceae archaeon]|nr:hypothetical protein [Methanotrichaceae archaeon]
MKTKDKIVRLAPYEEVLGTLYELIEYEDFLAAKIGKIMVYLPMEIKQKLSPFIGRNIAVLHTDIPQKQYLYRIPSEPVIEKPVVSDSLREACHAL